MKIISMICNVLSNSLTIPVIGFTSSTEAYKFLEDLKRKYPNKNFNITGYAYDLTEEEKELSIKQWNG